MMDFLKALNLKRHFRKAEQDKHSEQVKLHISPTGRVSVDPAEVVQTEAFKKELAAVKRLRIAAEEKAAIA